MNLEFPSVADFGLAPATEAFTRGFADYLVPIQSSPAILLGMARQDSVDLAASRVCVADGAAVGGALIARRGWTCRLAGMAIAPEARRRGIGKTMMTQLLAEARARGERAMVLEVIEQNAPAVRLYEGCGFAKVRRLIGAAGPAPAEPGEEVALEEIDPREVARAVDAHGLPELPWQLSAETLAQLGPPFRAYRGGPSWVVISNPAVSPVGLRAVVTEPSARGQGRAAALVRAVMARHPAKEWRASAVFPEEMAPLFAELGLARTPLTQWQMRRRLE
jgi:GNAT superfamily N-acetyltransferase